MKGKPPRVLLQKEIKDGMFAEAILGTKMKAFVSKVRGDCFLGIQEIATGEILNLRGLKNCNEALKELDLVQARARFLCKIARDIGIGDAARPKEEIK